MQIRQKLTYQFVSIVIIILVLFSGAVYYFSASYRKKDLYDRLKSRAVSVANLLIDIDEVDSVLLRKIEKDNPLSLPAEKIIVYNYTNEILFSTDNENTFKISPGLLDQIRLEDQIRFLQDKYEMFGILYTSKYDRFVVVAGAIDVYGLKKLTHLRTILLTGFGVCIVIIFVAGSIYSKKALLPISKVIKQVNKINASSMELRVDEGNKKDEIARLARTFNSMLDRLVYAITVQKSFIANASHELRTPLTSISGQLEVLLMQNRSQEYYKENIISVLDDVKNLNLMANRLLLLMQASAESSEVSFSQVRIDEILWQAKIDSTCNTDQYKVRIAFDHELNENNLTVFGSEQLIRSAIINLIDNGCKYSTPHLVKIYLTIQNGRPSIVFSDKGIGIPANDLLSVYEPFFRGQNTTQIIGHGIGLSLVQKIMQLHKGDITIQSEVNKGTIVTISFPPEKS